MGGIGKIRDALASPRGLASIINSPFIEIDREATAARLQLDRRGSENGALELPTADMTSFDPVEAEIISEIGDHAARATTEASNELGTYARRLLQLDRLSETATIGGTALAAISDLPAKSREHHDRLLLLREGVKESFGELRRFRERHRLDRPARRSSSWATFGTVAVSFIGDAFLNTSFLRVNDSLGWLGGAVEALVIAAVNIGAFGYVGGRAILPYTRHVNAWLAAPAYGLLLLWLVVLTLWNLGAAHLRDAKSAGLPAPETVAFERVASLQFTLDSIHSYALFGIGILFSLVAANRFLAMDDPYPGYGATFRRHEQRCRDYADEVADAREELTDMRDDAIARAATLRADLARQFNEAAQIQTYRQAFADKYHQHLDRLERDANALLERYRIANRKARTASVPSHFNASWSLTRPTVVADTPLPKLPDGLEQDIAAAKQALDDAVASINRAFADVEQSFVSLEALKAQLAHG